MLSRSHKFSFRTAANDDGRVSSRVPLLPLDFQLHTLFATLLISVLRPGTFLLTLLWLEERTDPRRLGRSGLLFAAGARSRKRTARYRLGEETCDRP